MVRVDCLKKFFKFRWFDIICSLWFSFELLLLFFSEYRSLLLHHWILESLLVHELLLRLELLLLLVLWMVETLFVHHLISISLVLLKILMSHLILWKLSFTLVFKQSILLLDLLLYSSLYFLSNSVSMRTFHRH